MTVPYLWWRQVDRENLLRALRPDAEPTLIVMTGRDSQAPRIAAELAAYTLEARGYECHLLRAIDVRLPTYASYLLGFLDLLEPGAVPNLLGAGARPWSELVRRVERGVRQRSRSGARVALVVDELQIESSRMQVALDSLAQLAAVAGCLVVTTVVAVPHPPSHPHLVLPLDAFTVADVASCLRRAAVEESTVRRVLADLFGEDQSLTTAVVAPMLAYLTLQEAIA